MGQAEAMIGLAGAGAAVSPGMSLIFETGARPDAAAIHALAAGEGGVAVSLDPSADAAATGSVGPDWLELLANGLSFDLAGLRPGPAATLPPVAYRYGLAEQGAAEWEAVSLQPGPHLAGASGMIPVARGMVAAGLRLARLPGLAAVAWHAARCWSSPEHFRTVAGSWLDGGAFPALGLAALAPAPDGGLQSEGLVLFTGQELRLEPELVQDRTAAARLAVRLINELVELGPLSAEERLTGPDGAELLLRPSANGRFVRVELAPR